MTVINLRAYNGSAVFHITGNDVRFARVYGASPSKDGWLFPAYPPFGLVVAEDLSVVEPRATWTTDASLHLEGLKRGVADLEADVLPPETTFHTAPFEHQKKGFNELVRNNRHALFWEAGTGKSKVVVDFVRHMRGKTLILGPPVTLYNWRSQFLTHCDGTELPRIAVLDGSPQKRAKLVAKGNADVFDVLIASYDTLRNVGFPRAFPQTIKAAQAAMKLRGVGVSSVKSLLVAVRKASSQVKQLEWVAEWINGASIATIENMVAEFLKTAPPQWLCDVKFDAIVADESHNLATPSSAKTKNAVALATKIPRRYILTGSLSKGDPTHVYGQMKFLGGGVIQEDLRTFQTKYLVTSPYNKHIVTGYKNLDILNARIARVASFKTKAECLDLPPRTVIDVPVAMASDQVKFYNRLVDELAAPLEAIAGLTPAEGASRTGLVEAQNAAILVNKLAQISGGFVTESTRDTKLCDNCPRLARCVDVNIQPYTKACEVEQKPPPGKTHFFDTNPKRDEVEARLKEVLSRDGVKAIIWAMYRAELDILEAMLKWHNIGYVRMDGSVSGNRQALVDKFNNEASCRVYLGQVQTGVGITLNAASYMFYYSLPWSLTDYQQSLDRNFRIGQTEKTTVYRFIGAETMDEFKVAALDAKEDVSRTLTKRVTCATCPESRRCLAEGINVFEKGCVYVRGVKKPIAKARLIANSGGPNP